MSETADRAITGRIFEIQRFSIHDGPGIRTTVFLQGCPLRCHWCHNPEGLEARPVLMFRPGKCIGCGYCFRVCKQDAHQMGNGEQKQEEGKQSADHILDREKCVRCGVCAQECYSGAIELVGRESSVDEVMAKVLRDKPFYETSGGGITLSGGEPFAQMAFSRALLETARAEKLHTAIETSAYAPWQHLQEIAPLVDLFLVDLKHTNDERHRSLTGVSNEPILNNLRRIIQNNWQIILRIPWVPGQNADEDFLNGLVDFLRSVRNPPQVQFMLYHRLGTGKWRALGCEPPLLENIPNASADEVQPWIERLSLAGLKAFVNP